MDNSVELIGYYGGDKTHALSAWTSTSRELTEEKEQRIPILLKQLADNGHGTPFEKSMIHFLVTTDIATHIHLLKHRIAVPVNGESARYKELKEDKFYIPKDWDIPVDSLWIKEERADTWAATLKLYTELGNDLYHECLEELTPVLGRKRAKESARFFKTYNSQITADISFNWRSFVHFYNLRADEHAQLEIQEVAKKMLELIKGIPGNPFEHSIKAFKL
jgi:flavin-dependent thymidylate synthase